MKNAAYKFACAVFGLTLIAFFLMGFAVVFTQIFGIFTGNSAIVKRVADLLVDHSVYLSTVSGFAGYLAYYTKPSKKSA